MSGLGLRLAASTSRAARVASRSCRVQSRALHKRKELSYPIEEGLGSFLSPEALKMIAVDYQQGLLDRLNDQVRGTALENKSIVQTIVNAAQDPNKVLEFNYASEALNNSFFLDNLKPPPADAASHEAEVHTFPDFYKHIVVDFGSMAHLQSTFSAAVLGMFSSGWIWLVSDQTGHLGVIPTFGPSTLLIRSGTQSPMLDEWQQIVGPAVESFYEKDVIPPIPTQGSAMHSNTTSLPHADSPLSGSSRTIVSPDVPTGARSMSYYARPDQSDETVNQSKFDYKKTGNVLYPLLCVSVHEHAWVGAGYGVWGKEEYMKRFWTVVDWAKVVKLYSKVPVRRTKNA